ncbi:MAG TPA: helix-turn-helix transcriptional regulator [Microbacterium sp.]|uniref:helix-turn-helix transcriptional regulator n=1 Tax=Microbacterium sp. TaxID=51671 RepID=UPI002BD6E5D4|nr:helix-turn-helix transcriptional regulator [Microbacterium sp.]HWI31684.1 helix-turn-helix transcriptional regulator [Microbacterium sp.]
MPTQAGPKSPFHAPSLWTRLAHAHIDALTSDDESPHRALIVGSARSGKTRMLRHVHRELADRGLDVAEGRPGIDLSRVPATSILLVDDAQDLEPSQLTVVAARMRDPEAGVVLACRPWPMSDDLRALARELEHAHPVTVLGFTTRGDVGAYLTEAGDKMTSACIDSVLELTGNATWLVAEALSIHDVTGCGGASDHEVIAEALQELIAYRLRSVDPELGRFVETLCLLPRGDRALRPAARQDLLMAGHAEGLLLRNGQPVPIVRATVRATTPIERRIDLYVDSLTGGADDPFLRELVGPIADPRVAAALVRQGDGLLAEEPRSAAEYYRSAAEAGAESAALAVRRAEAAWAVGAIDEAGALLDEAGIGEDHEERERAARVAAAIWAARGLVGMSHAVLQSTPRLEPETAGYAAMSALAAAEPDALNTPSIQPGGYTAPSTLTVSMDLLRTGLRSTLSGSGERALNDLVRASEMYTASGCASPAPEVPAVIAALAAIHLGEVDVAHTVLEDAFRERQSGPWARNRLLLWRGWVALQRQHPRDVDSALEQVLSSGHPLSPRERLLADAIDVASARRYGDTAALTTAWRAARESIIRAEFDLFSILPLGEFVVTAARTGDTARVRPHFERLLEQTQRLGTASAWSAHVHWAGIQQGMLLNRPGDLKPHARQLVASAPHNRLASMMAQAGRVWTDALAGHVDPAAVEQAAYGLASVGLAWDGARLAGHGAARTDDRRQISRLLACARHLHPRDEAHRTPESDGAAAPVAPRTNAVLSHREHEVAILVLQGKTYAEIGETIFISPRTAEHHIARIRRRLGATSRSDLIAKLRLVVDDDRDAHDLLGERHREAG